MLTSRTLSWNSPFHLRIHGARRVALGLEVLAFYPQTKSNRKTPIKHTHVSNEFTTPDPLYSARNVDAKSLNKMYSKVLRVPCTYPTATTMSIHKQSEHAFVQPTSRSFPT
jgi:hypothetical protein